MLDDLEEAGPEHPFGKTPFIPFSLPAEGPAGAMPDLPQPLGFAAAEYGRHAEAAAPPLPRQPLPSLDPAAIASELALAGADPAALVRARRDFAFRNHPDRVAPPLRERAARRMQIANALIDEALRSKARGP